MAPAEPLPAASSAEGDVAIVVDPFFPSLLAALRERGAAVIGVRSAHQPSAAAMKVFTAHRESFAAVLDLATFGDVLRLAHHIRASPISSSAVGVFAGTESATTLAEDLAAALGLVSSGAPREDAKPATEWDEAISAKMSHQQAEKDGVPVLPAWAQVRGRWPVACKQGLADGALRGRCLMVEPEAEPEGQRLSRKPMKLIFLDMDGPVAPYISGQLHPWRKCDRISDAPYAKHVDALRYIVDRCGGPESVKVILSSNWRTDAERMSWLIAQFKERGVALVGHTDVIHLHPAINFEACRVLEMHRVLESGVLGSGGPQWDPNKEVNVFKRSVLPSDWDVQSWIAIDDLPLDLVAPGAWAKTKYLASFLPLAEEVVGTTGWVDLPTAFADAMATRITEFRDSHFVKIDPELGLAGTIGALEDAICKLGPLDDSA